jgi:hypothetical protein
MASRIRRARTLVAAAGLSSLIALLTVGSTFASGGPGPWPK